MRNRIAGRIGVLAVASATTAATALTAAAPASASPPAGSGTVTQNGSTITFTVTGITGGPGVICVAIADLIDPSLGRNFHAEPLPLSGGNGEVSFTGAPSGKHDAHVICGNADGGVLVAAASPRVGGPPAPSGSSLGTSVITTTAPDTITASVSGVTRFGTAWCGAQNVQIGRPYTWREFSETQRTIALTDGAGSTDFSGLPAGRYLTRTSCARETGVSYMASKVTDISPARVSG